MTNSDYDLSMIIASSLSNFQDNNTINIIFSKFSNDGIYDNFGSELLLSNVSNKNTSLLNSLYNENTDESKITFLKAVRYLRKDENKLFLTNVKSLLRNNSEEVKIEAIKSLHFLLSHEDEINLFKDHLEIETSEKVRKEIYIYIGKI